MATETIIALELTEPEAQYLINLLIEDGHDQWREDLNPLLIPVLRKLGDSGDWPSVTDSA